MSKKKTSSTRSNLKGTTIRKQEAEIFCQLINKLRMNMDVSILLRNPAFRNLHKKLLNLRDRFED